MRFIRQLAYITVSVFLAMLAGAGAAAAADLSSVAVTASSLVPGDQTRYIVKFRADAPLDLSKGASIMVEFPPNFSVVRNDILAADPGCTLARLEYKSPENRFYAMVRVATSVKKAGNTQQCIFLPQTEQLVIPAHTDLYLIIPGIINAPAAGHNEIKLQINDAREAAYQGTGQFSLGLPPKDAPQHLRLAEVSSYKVRLAWDPVPDATRYRVVFSTQPAGQFISAMDLAREPFPGEEWQLAETTHSFSGRGNGGLIPGRVYYFKVQAGNESGFGSASAVLQVTMPEVKPLPDQPGYKKQDIIRVSQGDALVIRLDQPVKIVNHDAIRIYEKNSGIKVKGVRAVVEEADNSVIRISNEMQTGQKYLAVIYEGALESRIQPNVVNNTFGWTVDVTGG